MRKLISGLMFFFISTTAMAAKLEILNVNIPEAPPVAPVMAAYMTIVNPSSIDVIITSFKSSAFERVELHSMSMENGMMHMQQLNNFAIPANKQRSLEPGGFHLMLIKPRKTLRDGDSVGITFGYQDKTSQHFSFKVKK